MARSPAATPKPPLRSKPRRPRAAASPAAAELEAAFAAALQGLSPPPAVALAVSGGADSTALMHLAAGWALACDMPPPVVLTVDHRLQPGSAGVAAAVKLAAEALGLPAHILVWRGSKPAANIEAAARQARYTLMARWCARHGIGALLTAHTLEDQAETLLLRLGRGSGVDGLAAMSPRSPLPVPGFEGVALLRPLLAIARDRLTAFLQARGADWHTDPMNSDPRFARVRLRAAWPALLQAGLVPARLAAAATHLARARAALDAATESFLADEAAFSPKGARLRRERFVRLPREIGLRVLALTLTRVGGGNYRPRFERLERLYDAVLGGALGRGRTLAGCRIAAGTKRDCGADFLVISPEAGRRSVRPG